jgi:glycosyltransferase involved in cell wall biosynthesis
MWSEKLDMVCFGGEDWWYHNRGHIDMQLMRRFATNGTVLYVNSVVMQKPRLSEGAKFFQKLARKTKSIARALQKSDAGFWVYSPMSLPLHHKNWGRAMNRIILRAFVGHACRILKMRKPAVWVACPAAAEAAVKLGGSMLIYQKTDRYERFPNVEPEVIQYYDLLLRSRADLTVFVNEELYREQADSCRRALYLDHGVDFSMFSSAVEDKSVPAEIAGIKRPIVGFFGGIDDHTFDYQFMVRVAVLMPDVSFVFVGQPSIDCTELASEENVRMLGRRSYEQIPHYGKCFDVAIMPWRQNDWIRSCNPIKLKEYLALGRPVVSTPFTELSKYADVVYRASSPEEFAAAIRTAYSEDTIARRQERMRRVAGASWEAKYATVLDAIKKIMAGQIFN